MLAQSKSVSLSALTVTSAHSTQILNSLTFSSIIVSQFNQNFSTQDLIISSLIINMILNMILDSLSNAHENTNVKNITARALIMIIKKFAVDIDQLMNEIELADLDLDFLMSLVLFQKLHNELRIKMYDAFFLKVDIIEELKELLC